MKSSPIQILESFPEKILLTTRDDAEDSVPGSFEKLDLQVFRRIVECPEFWESSPPVEGLESRTFKVTLGIRTPKDKPAGPYLFEFVSSGIVACVQNISDKSPKELAYEYGLTILYGNMREQIATMTARMNPGIRFLPTLSFIGEKPQEPEPARPRAVRRRRVVTKIDVDEKPAGDKTEI